MGSTLRADRYTLELSEEEELKMLEALAEEEDEEIRRWREETETANTSK